MKYLVATFVLLFASSAWAAELTRGPYIQSVTPTSVTIVWRTSSPTEGRVWIDGRTFENGRNTQHEVVVSGLEAGRRYPYRVGEPDGPLSPDDATNYYVDTAPAAGAPHPVRAWIVGDSGNGSANQRHVRDAMLAATHGVGPDIYLHMGDMAYTDGTDSEFQRRFYDVYQDILRNTVVWPTMGNHEGSTSDSATESGAYYDGYVLPRGGEAGGLPSGTEAYYSYDWANIHFVVLDSHESSRSLSGPMFTWLREDLAATDQEWIVAYWHHPVYSKGTHDSDAEGQLIQMRERALPILEAAGVDLVMAGHSHIYERSYLLRGAFDTPTTATGHIVDPGNGKIDGDGVYDKRPDGERGTVYITAGHGGAGVRQYDPDHPVMFFTEAANGSVLLDVSGSVLTARNVRRDGAISDSFTLVKGDGVLVTWPVGGESLVVDEAYELAWTGTAESYRLEVGNDQTWRAIATVEGHRYMWRPKNAGENLQLRVTAIDGGFVSTSRPFRVTADGARVLIPFGATWAYWDRDDAPGDGWMNSDFDDSKWRFASAQFGYGETDQATDLQAGEPTYYFRHTFGLPNDHIENVQLDLIFDDSYEVWLNGTRIGSDGIVERMPHSIPGAFESMDNEWARRPIDRTLLKPTGNILAVRIKPVAASDDASFDARLTGAFQRVRSGQSAEPAIPALRSDTHRVPAPPISQSDGCTSTPSSANLPAPLMLAIVFAFVRRRREP